MIRQKDNIEIEAVNQILKKIKLIIIEIDINSENRSSDLYGKLRKKI